MPFSSSPELDEGASLSGNPGANIGGQSPDANREMQLQAMREAKLKDEAVQQREEYEKYKAQQDHREAAATRVRDIARRNNHAKEQASSYACSCVTMFVVAVLFYLLADSFLRSRRGYS